MAEGALPLLDDPAGSRRGAPRPGGDDSTHPLLDGLTPEQRDAVTTQVSPLCIIAGAGSGKTRVLTRRIAWQADQGLADPRRTLAVTFTRRAARELRARLRRLGLNDAVRAGTFHAIALAQLRRHAADRSRRPPRILASPHELISELRPRTDRGSITDIINEIGWARARLVTPERYAHAARAARRRSPVGRAERFAQLYADYEAKKAKRRVLDFDDVLAQALHLMTSDPKHAAARRWMHQHLLVDEFQDINPLQFALLRSWLGPDSTLLAVGDPDQAIYGWNGADPELINRVGEHFRGCAVVRLRTNFRSTPEVLAAAGRVLGRSPQPAARPSGREPVVTECDGADEAALLVDAVCRRHRPGAPWARQAVLARTNDQLAPLRRALAGQHIPVAARGEGGLLGKPWVAAVLASWPDDAGLASCSADTRQELHWADPEALADTGAEGRSHERADIDHRGKNLDRSHDKADDYGGNITGRLRGRSDGYRESSPDRSRERADIEALLGLAEDHLALEPDATVGSFRTALGPGDRPTVPSDGVNLLTFHAAKGLEWPVVHIVGLEEGYMPIAHARSAAALAEERRLLYVAVTRAEQELHLMWCSRRDVGGQSAARKPSPWMEGIGDGADEDAESQRALNLEGLARARRAVGER